MSNTLEQLELSSANILQIKLRQFGKPFMQMRNRSGPKIGPRGTPERIILQDDFYSFIYSLLKVDLYLTLQ